MKPVLILSHGLDSSPDATKVSALAAVAEALGYASVRPDYRNLDATGDVRRIDERIARLVEHAPKDTPVILAGSSMGAFISGLASLQVNCVGLFLMALPVAIPGYARRFEAARVPTSLVHGWGDELCAADEAISFARARNAEIALVDDDHRLSVHVNFVAENFARFLRRFA